MESLWPFVYFTRTASEQKRKKNKKTKKGKTIKKLNERKENGCLSLPAMCILMFDPVVEYSTEAAMRITQFDEDRHLDYK